MLFWHLGASLWLFRWIFKDPKVDIRFLFAGVLLPDIIDLLTGTVLFPSHYSSGELWFHSLIVPALYMAGVLLATRRGRRRRAYMALGIGWLFHLLLDGMFTVTHVFLWPFFGWAMVQGVEPFWSLAWERALSDPWRWVLELAGLGYLIWLWFAVGLDQKERRTSLWKTGRIPDFVADRA